MIELLLCIPCFYVIMKRNMKLTGVTEKIRGFLGIFKGLLNSITGVFSALFAKTASLKPASLKKDIKTKGPKGKKSGGKENYLKNLQVSLTGKFNSLADNLTGRFLGRFPEEKRRPILFAFMGLMVIFLVLIVSVLAINSGKSKRGARPESIAGPVIPGEELFSPGEPDFLPEYILEREPRRFWTVEDIRPYWKNPLASPESSDYWQGEIKTTVDKLLEGVP